MNAAERKHISAELDVFARLRAENYKLLQERDILTGKLEELGERLKATQKRLYEVRRSRDFYRNRSLSLVRKASREQSTA